jgi:hypothetical protein
MALYTLYDGPSVSGKEALRFSADTLAHAQAFGQSFATLCQRTVTLVLIDNSAGTAVIGPFTSYTPAASGTSVSSNGITI